MITGYAPISRFFERPFYPGYMMRCQSECPFDLGSARVSTIIRYAKEFSKQSVSASIEKDQAPLLLRFDRGTQTCGFLSARELSFLEVLHYHTPYPRCRECLKLKLTLWIFMGSNMVARSFCWDVRLFLKIQSTTDNG